MRLMEEFQMIAALWTCSPVQPLTAADRMDRVAKDLEAVRQELGE